jgi:hypothetical protein
MPLNISSGPVELVSWSEHVASETRNLEDQDNCCRK